MFSDSAKLLRCARCTTTSSSTSIDKSFSTTFGAHSHMSTFATKKMRKATIRWSRHKVSMSTVADFMSCRAAGHPGSSFHCQPGGSFATKTLGTFASCIASCIQRLRLTCSSDLAQSRGSWTATELLGDFQQKCP